MSDLAILVSSSDRTRDVFERVFSHFEALWPGCPYRRYVGVSSASPETSRFGFEVVPARRSDGWRTELAAQVRALPTNIEFVLLLLDDFLLLRPVHQPSIEAAYQFAKQGRLPYLRLKPVERSLWMTAVHRLGARLGGTRAIRLRPSEPYYASLQAAIWRRDHLLRCLEQPGSIWEFEHFVPGDEDHYAVTTPALAYRHVVEKGLWRAYAPQLFARLGLTFDPGQRAMRAPGDRLRFRWEQCKFGLFGYMGPRAMQGVRWLLGKRSTPLGTISKRELTK